MFRAYRWIMAIVAVVMVAAGLAPSSVQANDTVTGDILYIAWGKDITYVVINADGTNQQNLLSYAVDWFGGVSRPSLSSDGSMFASSHCYKAQPPYVESCFFYLVNTDREVLFRSKNSTILYSENPSLSPDGKRVVYEQVEQRSDGLWEISINSMNSDGTEARKLTPPDLNCEDPSWSPDGKHIVFTHASSVYVMDADGSNIEVIATIDKGYYPYPYRYDRYLLAPNALTPIWSPLGDKMAFGVVHRMERWTFSDIYVTNVDGTNLRKLTDVGYNSSSSWSPDGERITFESQSDLFGKSYLYTVNADGTHRQQLTNTGFDSEPAWSPDGKRIAFVSRRSGDDQIFVMNSDGSDQHPITSDKSVKFHPSWIPHPTK